MFSSASCICGASVGLCSAKLFSLFSVVSWLARFSAFFLSRFALFCLGNELVILELVAVIKLLLAALRNGVGSALRMRWLVGIALVGGSGV